MKIYARDDMNRKKLMDLVNNIAPDAILCAGWMDKGYLDICRKAKPRSVTIMTMDNKWLGNFRQRLAVLYARFFIVPAFHFVWVPGDSQKKFAMKLGFPEKNIRTGFYSADTSHFFDVGKRLWETREKKIAKRFIYAARYYEFKGLNELLEAFRRLRNETGTDWELWCAGTGSIVPPEIEGVKHFGFVQPDELEELMKETSVFILPSKIEPWGVAVHEFACAGFPLLLSDQVGARESFLSEGENGYSFRSGSVEEIVNAMKKVIVLNDEQLISMGKRSRELAAKVTTLTWVQTLIELLD
jgi:glycosyltransferase involved in cell wall biosynthesis